MVNWGSGEVGEDNLGGSPEVMGRGAMAPRWATNRAYLFPVPSGMLCPERMCYDLPNWQLIVLTCHLIF